MQAPRSEAYLDTRVSLLARRLLDDAALRRFQERGLEQLASVFGLGAAIDSGLNPQRKNRAVEQALISTLMVDVAVLQRPLTGARREMLTYWSRKLELFNLKALIRGKINGLSTSRIEENLYDLPASIRLPGPNWAGRQCLARCCCHDRLKPDLCSHCHWHNAGHP